MQAGSQVNAEENLEDREHEEDLYWTLATQVIGIKYYKGYGFVHSTQFASNYKLARA